MHHQMSWTIDLRKLTGLRQDYHDYQITKYWRKGPNLNNLKVKGWWISVVSRLAWLESCH